ncbi:MAG: hypothetical protein FJ115_03610 [Deltaproteobacteria bacterium]|nr:hypothetical protein [Deltaproteobacteria bacterium]
MFKNAKLDSKLCAFTLMFILFLPLLPENVFSWGKQVHVTMTDQSIELMPNDFFLKYRRDLRLGTVEPDENRVINHTNVPDCVYMINKLAKKCEEMIKNGEEWSKVMFTMGQATHYIQDINNPHHGIGYYIKGDHEKFEEIATIGYWRKEHFDGFYLVKNYRIFGINNANWSKKYFDLTYELTPPYYDNDLYKKLLTPLWNHSVHSTFHLWLSIMWNGLGERKYKELGFPDPVGTRDDQRIKFYRITELK